MSFAGTPLGQGRRLDHNTFFGKPPSNSTRPPSPHRIPTSFSYGAPALGSRSPPKPSNPEQEPGRPLAEQNTNTDSALSRYARIKQGEQRPSGPKIITSPPHPEKWSVKDTTVNVATAFHQAAAATMPIQNQNPHNQSWASSSRSFVPRSTSVEYEQESQTIINRRAAQARSSVSRGPTKPLSKSGSTNRVVPDSEGEDDRLLPPHPSTRAKSPFDTVLDTGARVLSAATYYVRQRSREPEGPNGKDASYEYSAEERDFQSTQAKKSTATHRKNRMSVDNKAYKPSKDSEDESDDEVSDDGRKRRKKKSNKNETSGRLILPVISADKQRRRKKKGTGGVQGEEESESDDVESQKQDKPPSLSSRQSATRASAPRNVDISNSFEQPVETSLESIPEDQEMSYEDKPPQGSPVSAAAGRLVYYLVQSVRWVLMLVVKTIYMILFLCGRLLGLVGDVVYLKPRQLARGTPIGLFIAIPVATVLLWYAFQNADQLASWIPSSKPYTSPGLPAADISELNTRLLKIESTLELIAAENHRIRTRTDSEARNNADVASRLGNLETRVQKENSRVIEAETHMRVSTTKSLHNLQHDLEVLQAKLEAGVPSSGSGEGIGSDEEARAMLRALAERVGSVEGDVKEALELGKNSVKAGSDSSWWSKLGTGKKALTIKSSDGQDVTSLISHMVDSAVTAINKDTLAKPDFALYSGGGRVIPTLTSPVLQMRAVKNSGWLTGMFRRGELASGRPPVTALHHEIHNGYCWPFAGSEGQLGVALAAPAYISEVSIDHVSKDVAFDLRSAPRQMEVWGLVEGKDNIARVKEWQEAKASRRAIAVERGEPVEEEEPYPPTLPKKPQYIKIASFTYNIHSPYNVQTFPVLDDIRELGVDFGIVALRIKSNWGREDFTCLYRFRVHGEKLGETPLPYPEDFDLQS